MTASELARILGIRQPTAHGLVENLIVEGLVERSPGRGRAMALRLTEGGLRHAAELQAARLNAVGNLLVGLEPIDLVQLDRLLSRILARATTDRATARTICRSCDHAICTGPDCPVGRAATAAEQGGAE